MTPNIYHRAPFTSSLIRREILGDALEKRGTPKIGGSVGGFIALVVGLSLIILISCIAIFLLLREGQSSDEERAARRRRYRQQALEYTYGPTASPQSASWSSKVRSVFGVNSGSGKGSKRGWVQAGSGDEWETESLEEGRLQRPDISQRGSMQMTYSPPLDAPFHPPLQPSESASSVRFDIQSVPVLPYLRSLSSPSPHPSLPNIHSRISSPTPSDPLSPVHDRVVSPEPIVPAHVDSPVEHHEGRKLSEQSATSVRTFNGGTKFLEAL
ncbi:hypothetical protein EV421DRAFT_1904847 [Armillaria borealis]|uniref:Uncharacterized protein n=1 Tax=Armillaria borealis TaxID=47425 RepID=A0AA39JFD8_9AGAR|nr:hypothetical protein EV421DRAFT_1904847 [Armillaria borealis]